jgi:phage tail-like protein
MARSQTLDFLHNMRFHVTTNAAIGAAGDITTGGLNNAPEAGFSACTVPEATIESVEYKEGQYLYTRKYPGHVTYADVTMSRGVARVESGFWRWIRTVIEGTGEYRVEVDIKHYHRTDVLPGAADPPAENLLIPTALPARIYRLYQAYPARHKFSSDLDGTDSAVSIMELDVAYEHCSLLDGNGNVVTT